MRWEVQLTTQAQRPGTPGLTTTSNLMKQSKDAMPGSLQRMVRRITCCLRGHPCEPTGRHAILLVEWKCKRCGGLYVSHAHHGNALMSADDGSDRIFRDCMDAIKAADAYPPNGDSATK